MKKIALAFAASTCLVAAPATASSTPAPVTEQVASGVTLHVRTAASTTSKVAGSLTSGTTVTGTVSNGWMHLTLGSFVGDYVSTTYLTNVAAKPSAGQKVGYVMADPSPYGSQVNIRRSPSLSSAIVGHYGAHARVVGTPVGDGSWWKVAGGYINSALVETLTSDPSTMNARIPTSDLCVVPAAYYSKLPAGVIGYGYTTATKRYVQCGMLPHLEDLENAYRAHFGSYAGIDDAYRTFAEQAYWYATLHGVNVSKPGQSNHGYGLAVDFQASYPGHKMSTFEAGGTGRTWLLAHAGAYGFGDIGPSDAVHWNFIG